MESSLLCCGIRHNQPWGYGGAVGITKLRVWEVVRLGVRTGLSAIAHGAAVELPVPSHTHSMLPAPEGMVAACWKALTYFFSSVINSPCQDRMA